MHQPTHIPTGLQQQINVTNVYRFPVCCRRKMIHQPSRDAWWCRSCNRVIDSFKDFSGTYL